jgi:hypothetical protein
VSVEIVRLLLGAGVSETELEGSLAEAHVRGKSLAKLLADTRGPLYESLERELGRREVPSIEIVRPSQEHIARLPPNLCERLAIVPVRQDPRTGRIDVAALDPVDPHLVSELEFHLGAKVRVLRARPDLLEAALPGGAPRNPSGPPMPLVRKSAAAEYRPRPLLLEEVPATERSDPPSELEEAEPVLSLSRPKSSPITPAAPTPHDARAWPGGEHAPKPAAKLAPVPAEPIEAVLEELRTVISPDVAVSLLLRGMAPAATLVLAARAGGYEGRAASLSLPLDAARKVRLEAGTPSVIETALRTGFYLGALPMTPEHAELRMLFGGSGDSEVYVVPVQTSGRPSLVLISEIEALGGSVEATRRADELAYVAGEALTRILFSKKRRV